MWLRLKVIFLAFAMALCVKSTASAAPIIMAGDSVKVSDGPGTINGGEFILLVNDSWSFVTFCLQMTQYIDFTNVYHVDAVSPFASTDPAAKGGDALGRDYLSQETAFLLTMFVTAASLDTTIPAPVVPCLPMTSSAQSGCSRVSCRWMRRIRS